MTLHTAVHTAGGGEDVVSARLANVALWALNGPGPLDVRTGVVFAPGNPMQVTGTSSTSPWTVTVNTGHIVTSKGNSNGVYYSCNDAPATVNLSAPPSSNSRIDTIYAMQQDAAAVVFPDGSTAAVIDKVEGTAGNGGLGASPTAPPVPTGAVALATVQIFSTATAGTSGANVTLTNLPWAWTVPRGTAIPVRNATERSALTQYNGLRVNRLDMGYVEESNGATWTPQVDTFTGSETVVKGSAPPAGTRKIRYCGSQIYTTNASGQFAVTFFAAFPNGLVSLAFTAGDGAGGLRFVVTDEFNTSLAIGVGLAYNGSNTLLTSTNIRINYIAEGW